MEMLQVEVWIVVDESGDYGVGKDEDQAAQNYADDIGNDDNFSKRRIKVVLNVPKPAPVVVSATIPAESNEVAVSVS